MSYVIRRLLLLIPTLLLLATIVFGIIRLKGDPLAQLIPPDATAEDIELLRKAYGFDRPIYVQYFEFMRGLVRGDFGKSFRYRSPALSLVLERMPVTAKLAGWAVLLAVAISVPLGMISAVRQNSFVDLFATTASVIGRAMPPFWIGLMLMLLFAVQLRWLPVSGYGTTAHLVLPAITLGSGLATSLTRLVRSSMLEVIRADYITTARAKGLGERVILYKHALRNALIPVITMLGLQISWLLGGSTVIEEVFAIPGMGRLMINAVMQRDMGVVQAGVFVFGLIVVISNLTVDILYTIINPRVRYQ